MGMNDVQDFPLYMYVHIQCTVYMYILRMISVTLVRSNGLNGNALASSYVMTWMKNVYNVQTHMYMHMHSALLCTCTCTHSNVPVPCSFFLSHANVVSSITYMHNTDWSCKRYSTCACLT